MTSENTMTAAILGELIPELQYAAPLLLERLDRGEPLVGTAPPTDLGFDPGAVDSVLLEFFKALVPYVKTVLGLGMLPALQAWQSSKRDSRHHAELVARLDVLIEQDAKLGQIIDKATELLARMDGAPVSRKEFLESIATASRRVATRDDDQS